MRSVRCDARLRTGYAPDQSLFIICILFWNLGGIGGITQLLRETRFIREIKAEVGGWRKLWGQAVLLQSQMLMLEDEQRIPNRAQQGFEPPAWGPHAGEGISRPCAQLGCCPCSPKQRLAALVPWREGVLGQGSRTAEQGCAGLGSAGLLSAAGSRSCARLALRARGCKRVGWHMVGGSQSLCYVPAHLTEA